MQVATFLEQTTETLVANMFGTALELACCAANLPFTKCLARLLQQYFTVIYKGSDDWKVAALDAHNWKVLMPEFIIVFVLDNQNDGHVKGQI